MSESLISLVLYSEEPITDELPDVALEVAAGKCCIAFCSGLDTCPAHPPIAPGQS
jgi:hypothetical protein